MQDQKLVTLFRRKLLLLFSSVFASVLLVGVGWGADERPNIVLIMADDMGYTDIGCYGSEIETPTLDGLAENGLRFTQFYNTSRCCPTRAALLTGLFSHQAGIGLMTSDRGHDAYRGDLNNKCVTLAQALRPGGYRTYMSGKWHVTKHIKPEGPKFNWPIQRGFDRFYGTIIGAGSFYDPTTLCRDNTFITPENDPLYQPEAFHYTEAISDNAVQFVSDHYGDQANRDKPFFMYVSYTSAHWPMHAFEKDIKKYKGKYDGGFEPIRKARYEKAIKLGMIDSYWKMSPPDSNWDKNSNKEWDIRCMEVYAAMVDQMDRGIGRIVAELKRNGAFENTLIIYLQDNGGCAEPFGRRSNLEKIQNKTFPPLGRNGLQPQIWPPMQTRDGRAVRTGPEVMPGPEDSYVAYGRGWANVSNTPFRGYKHDGLEGGISTPFIVHWPKGIGHDYQHGIINDPAHLIDVMPTLIEVSGASYPEQFEGESVHPMEGISLVPTFSGQSLVRKNPLGFEHHGNLALRDGDWKIVSQYKQKQERSWQLFNMVADRTELKDLSEEFPDKKKELLQKYRIWADRVGAVDWPFKKTDK